MAYLLVLAAGAGLAMPTLSHAIVASVPAHQAGMGSGLQGAARELGAALGIAVVGTALSVRYATGTAHGSSAAVAFADAAALGYRIAAVVVLVGRRRDGRAPGPATHRRLPVARARSARLATP
ncbi:hypothetical protein O1L55_04065 [Streptomyces albulus]|nr:hypothetical protein [Streptomyces noursei]